MFIMFIIAVGFMADDQQILPFTFGGKSGNDLFWRGEIFIQDDGLTFYPNEKLSIKLEKNKVSEIEGWNVFNAWNENPALPIRRELGISKDNREVELNFQANQPAYHQKEGIREFGYSFRVPLDRLKGMKYMALVGRSHKSVTINGELTDQTPNKNFLSGTRYLVFEGNGKKIIFDFGPEGPGTYSTYAPNTIVSIWNVEKTPTHLVFSFGGRNTNFGGMLSSKLRIFESDTSDYLTRHANFKYLYYDPLPVEKAFCFGAPVHGKNFTDVNLDKYSTKKGFGWLDTTGLVLKSAMNSGAVYTAATSSGKMTFRCDLKRPGLYIFTLRCAGYGKKLGPFSISANGQTIAEKIQLKPYTLKNITWSQWVENGMLDITFDGVNWAVSVLGAQMLQHSNEDFKFRRGYWLINRLFEPHPLNGSAIFEPIPKYAIAISEIELPTHKIDDPENIPDLPKAVRSLPDQNSPKMDWRYTNVIGSLGPDNNGAFTEFNTSDLIERRLNEIRESGVNTILINGLLSRHTFKSQLDRVEKNITEIARIGHAKGMKIMDHQDLTLLWNMGEGYRIMCDRIGETQVTIGENFPLRGFCLNNKQFNETYFKWVTDFVRKTDIDGIMIDEASFFGLDYCGCVDCRKKFTAETGLVFPFDETSPVINNKDSKLWKIWIEWRKKAVGDWNVELRNHIASFKPNFSMMKYITHGGFTNATAPNNYGLDLLGAARSCDFLGTEIMSRNVMASYRSVFAFRKLKNSLRTEFGCPIFGLVYSLESHDFAYFGWAVNNMNAQVTWKLVTAPDKISDKYTDFKNNFNIKYARPVSDIALLYSFQSRDWGRGLNVTPDVMGMSQLLTDNHIMHDFFFEESMRPDFLKKYRVILVNSASSLNDIQIERLLNYAKDGGTLFITGTTGICDKLGTPRKDWPFADILGVRTSGGNKPGITEYPFISFSGQKPIKYSKMVVDLTVDKTNPPEIIANVLDKDGKSVQPLIVERQYGKGRIIYCAAQPGAANYEAERTVNDKWEYSKDNEINNFYTKTIKEIILGSMELPFEAVAIPEKVLTSVYRQEVDGKITTTVHLLNATGVNMKPGQKIPASAPQPVWPEPNKDIVFDISLPKLTKAVASSPEWHGFKPVKSKSIGTNRYRITVSKEMVKSYSIIFLEQ